MAAHLPGLLGTAPGVAIAIGTLAGLKRVGDPLTELGVLRRLHLLYSSRVMTLTLPSTQRCCRRSPSRWPPHLRCCPAPTLHPEHRLTRD